MHVVAPSGPSTPEELENMTKEYQKNIRNSPMWAEMEQYGKEKAEESAHHQQSWWYDEAPSKGAFYL
jgi:hypothetical protein